MLGGVPDDKPPEPPITHQDVGPQAQYEIGDARLAGGHDSRSKVVRGVGFIIEVRRTSYFEGGVWT